MGILFLIVGLGLFYLSYRFYAKFLSEKIWKLDPKVVTPAHQFKDGFEYVPTRMTVVWGHHFTSIAGAGPIVGPIVAAIWGWLPGLLWIVFGTIFMGAVKDIGALVTSLRHQGRGISDYLKDLLGPRATQLMYAVVFFLLVLVSAVFIHVIATLLKGYPEAVWSVWIEVPLAIAIGCIAYYKLRVNLVVSALLAVAIMYAFIWVGAQWPIKITYWGWVFILLAYILIAARLPVWLMVQPRDFINAYQLVIALGLLTIGVFALGGAGELAAPAVRVAPKGAPPIWPFVMITIACGAMSGFHSLVGSGTASKQIDKETDAKPVGYGAMLAEGYLAIIAILIAVVGLGAVGYAKFYGVWGAAVWPKIWAEGGKTFLAPLGIPAIYATAFMAVVAVSFANTTLDSAMRFTRIVVAESARTFKWPKILQERTVSLLPGFAVIAALAFSKYQMELWPLFGAANQILAGLSLLATGVFLWRLGRPNLYYIIPFIIAIITSMTAMAYSVIATYIPKGQWVLAGIGTLIFLCALGVIVVAYQTWRAKAKASS